MIYAGMIAYNEEHLIGASIKSAMNAVDKVIVIDGSPWGPSTDHTAEIASSLGSKVTVISGTWQNEMLQRNACLDRMVCKYQNWCIKLDADEVWLESMLQDLIEHVRYAKRYTMLFRYRSYEFFKNGHTVELDQRFAIANALGTWRLTPDVFHRSYHQVGTKSCDWTSSVSPITKILPEVWFHHYGHAQSEERVREKHLIALRLGLKRRYGFASDEEQRYLKERWPVYWNPSSVIRQRDLGTYAGPHPKQVCGLIEGVE